MMVIPSGRWRTWSRPGECGSAEDRAVAIALVSMSRACAAAAAARALCTWCSPSSRRVTGAEPDGVCRVNRARAVDEVAAGGADVPPAGAG